MNFDKYIHRHWNTTFEKMSKSEVPTGAMGTFEITTFVHPHLFWLIEVESKIRQKTLHELDTSMKELCKQQSRDSATTFEAGDIVIVQYEGHLYRAILEYIGEQKSCSNGQYLCWLMDYGTLVESNTIFKSSPKIRKILPLSFQASLNNVVYTIQHLGFGETGNVVTKTEYLLSPTPPCHQASMDVLKTVRTIEFCVEEKDEGILFGDVIYKDKNGNKKSFKQYLLDKGIVGISEELFPDMKSFINEYREKNIQLIEKICKTSSNTISRRKACCDIKKKSIEEFEEVEISEEEMRRPRRRIRDANETDSLKSKSLSESNSSVSKSSRSHGNEQLDSFNTSPGQEDVSSQHELSSQAPSLSKSSKMAILRKKIEEKKANQKENTTLESSSSSGKGQGKCKITDVNKESGGKIELCPAGAERTFFGAQGVEKPKPTSETKPQSLNNRRSKPQATVPVSMETHQRRCAAQNESPDSSTDSSSECKNNIANTFGDQNRKGLNYDGESLSLESKTSTSVSIRSASNMEIKPHCRCKVCDRWTKDQGWGEGGEFEKYKPKVKLIGESKHEFLKEGTDDEPSEILSVDYNSLTRLEKKAMPKLLVHSECLPSPVKELANVYLHPDIYQTLVQEECKVTRLVQTYAWPALLRNQHVFMINGPHTGKTTAYLTTMCSFLVEKDERYSFTKKLSGAPIIVILCSNTERCRDVNDRARLIMGRNKARIELVEYPISHVNTTHIDMLITTPTIFVDLLKRRSVILNGLCHLVFEDGDNILNHYYPLIDIILEQTHKMLKNRHHSKSLQLIMCAEHWTKKITCVLQKLAAIPVVCIANYLEAAMYGKIQFSMRFMRSSAKPEMMKRLLKDTYKFTKSVIICNIAEVDELETTLIMSGIEAAVISEKLTVDETHLIEENWTKAPGGNYTVLVTTDHLLNTELNVTSATMLIHYSLPYSWTKFTKRFACLLESYRSPLDQRESKITTQSIVLLDENCQEELPKFFKYIKTTDLKHYLCDELKQYSEELSDESELNKVLKGIELCETLKVFGKCPNMHNCPMRHKIDKTVEDNPSLPTHGKIKFKIKNVYDVTNYSIEILESIVENSCNGISDVTERLADRMSESRKKPKVLVLGHLYVYYGADDSSETYHRCVLMAKENETVRVKLIDEGKMLSTLKNRLYKLPNDLGEDKFPRKYADIYLANLIPPYGDKGFSNKALYILNNTLEKHDYKNIVLTGYIHLQLSNTLWLTNVEEEVVLSDKVLTGFQLTREILQKQLAVTDLNQLDRLYKLCAEAGFALPKYEVESVRETKEEKIIPHWAHLEIETVQEVIFSSAISPDEMYVRLYKYSDLLYTLQKDILQAIKKPHYPRLSKIKPGTICLAKDPESEDYSRCIILKNDEEKALCFFVDFGDEAVVPTTDLKYLSNEFITKLPFQSISCKLFGIKPVLEEWSSEPTELLYEYATEPQTDIFRSLYVKVCGKERIAISDYCQNRYTVLLKDGFGNKKPLINELFVDCGLALPTEDKLEDFEIPESYEQTEESDDDVEMALDILKKTDEARENFHPNKEFQQEEINEDMELFLEDDDLIDFVDQVVNFYRKEDKSVFKQELPRMQAAPSVGYLTPEVFWYQTDTAVKLSVKVTDVKDYKVTLTKGRILLFKTQKGKDEYCLKLMLYHHIGSLHHTSAGLDVRITLIKKNLIEWPRLILPKQKARNIHYDVSMLQVKEEKKRILELPKELDEADADSDDELDMCYEVYSDMDSDFDQEVAQDSD